MDLTPKTRKQKFLVRASCLLPVRLLSTGDLHHRRVWVMVGAPILTNPCSVSDPGIMTTCSDNVSLKLSLLEMSTGLEEVWQNLTLTKVEKMSSSLMMKRTLRKMSRSHSVCLGACIWRSLSTPEQWKLSCTMSGNRPKALLFATLIWTYSYSNSSANQTRSMSWITALGRLMGICCCLSKWREWRSLLKLSFQWHGFR